MVTLKQVMVAAAGLVLIVGLALTGGAQVPPEDAYTTVPPYVSQTVAPNVMILLDTSGSMNRAFDSTGFQPLTDVNQGPFDATECYNYQVSAYGGNALVANPAANPPAVAPIPTCPVGYPWSGNLLNYGITIRADVSIWALIGGRCATARDS
ncbi:MAG TPA: hypothetical protein VES96_03200, partial [Nitrospiraceae bacterium]|nr:hypothetical protein [Nitrospiraceae bacterium]